MLFSSYEGVGGGPISRKEVLGNTWMAPNLYSFMPVKTPLHRWWISESSATWDGKLYFRE